LIALQKQKTSKTKWENISIASMEALKEFSPGWEKSWRISSRKAGKSLQFLNGRLVFLQPTTLRHPSDVTSKFIRKL
jgi:hypothetical protein